MGQPVVHFEIVGKDSQKLHEFYATMFDWKINADNPSRYGIVDREDNLSPEGIGIGGGIAGYENVDGHVTFYVGVDDVEAALVKAESLGGTRVMGPESPIPGTVIGLFTDVEGHLVGVVSS